MRPLHMITGSGMRAGDRSRGDVDDDDDDIAARDDNVDDVAAADVAGAAADAGAGASAARLGGHTVDAPLDRAMFTQHARLRVLEQQLYGHVLDAINFDALSNLEQSLFGLLTRRMNIGTDLALDLSALLIQRAIVRAADDEERFADFGPPPGITEAERKAVEFDERCPFCRIEAADAAEARRDRDRHGTAAAGGTGVTGVTGTSATSGTGVDDEPCPCCEALADEWREEHRAILEKAGLWRTRDAPQSFGVGAGSKPSGSRVGFGRSGSGPGSGGARSTESPPGNGREGSELDPDVS